ncbi:3278_t:CDS:1 [Acaulospora morrowiae]|uniref:3278_t:CDS:1 n=1 Tax=Acaulospora morrowiae TaxID=94023 RepID=A0A9N9I8S5_9GLOM|nr:3278_t:CDS:1 [Acaulospora morrowiae]
MEQEITKKLTAKWNVPKEILEEIWEPQPKTIEKLDDLTVNQWLNKWEIFGKQEILKHKDKWENPRPITLEEMIKKSWDTEERKPTEINGNSGKITNTSRKI